MAARPLFNFVVLKKIERRSRCHKLSAFTATVQRRASRTPQENRFKTI